MEAIDKMQSYTDGYTLEAYLQDSKTQSSVERQLQIVSEAAYRLGKEAHAICPGPDWSDLCGLGNVLRHGYHKIDDRIIWEKLAFTMPPLKFAVQATLATLPPEED